jgi:hypothetical protein
VPAPRAIGRKNDGVHPRDCDGERAGAPAGALSSVERAPLEADGSLGPFTLLETVALVKKRLEHSVTVLGDRLHAVGGTGQGRCGAANPVIEPSIEAAAIDPDDGSLGCHDHDCQTARRYVSNAFRAPTGQGLYEKSNSESSTSAPFSTLTWRRT